MSADLKLKRGAMICAAQEQALRTNLVKHIIDKTFPYPSLKLHGICINTTSHTDRGFNKLA